MRAAFAAHGRNVSGPWSWRLLPAIDLADQHKVKAAARDPLLRGGGPLRHRDVPRVPDEACEGLDRGGPGHGEHLAGRVPLANLNLDGHEGTSPVGSFPPNGYGLLDVTGNRVGVDQRVLHKPQQDRALVLRTEQPASPHAGRFVCSRRRAGVEHPAQGHQRRFAPLAPPTTACATGRQRDSHKMIETGTAHLGFRCILRPEAT
jgi:hypothetical protein